MQSRRQRLWEIFARIQRSFKGGHINKTVKGIAEKRVLLRREKRKPHQGGKLVKTKEGSISVMGECERSRETRMIVDGNLGEGRFNGKRVSVAEGGLPQKAKVIKWGGLTYIEEALLS